MGHPKSAVGLPWAGVKKHKSDILGVPAKGRSRSGPRERSRKKGLRGTAVFAGRSSNEPPVTRIGFARSFLAKIFLAPSLP